MKNKKTNNSEKLEYIPINNDPKNLIELQTQLINSRMYIDRVIKIINKLYK